MSVIGYDDDEIARHLSPPLTSMNLADRSMGRWVIDQFLHGPTGNTRHPLTKLECELVERDFNDGVGWSWADVLPCFSGMEKPQEAGAIRSTCS
ncbi:MAG: substrate-binding domain-containing protein [Pseudomonadota bacterium]